MTQPQAPFDPAQVPINYTLNFQQVNLLLEGLSELPRKKTEGFYEQFRGVALQTLQAAEKAAADTAAKQAQAEQIVAAAEQGNPVAQAVLATEDSAA